MNTLAHEHDKSSILRRLKNIGPQHTRRWGRMSAHQMVCHLSDSFRMATGKKYVSDDSNLFGRTIVKWIALYVPLQWPGGIATVPEVDQEAGGTRPGDFAIDLAELEGLVEDFTTQTTRLERRPHPIFGPLSETAWLRWGYLHTDHHLRQFGA